tara:strand:- start:16344 stop:16727 length:384 start_codon:yes stop_codon:yes gene_type:complete
MRFVTLGLLSFAAACATPREACLSQVNKDQSVLERLVVETRGNLARGYAVETQQKMREVRAICRSTLPDGTEIKTRCTKTQVREVRVPVAIDLNAERAKLASLEERQQQMQANAQVARQQCLAANPA